MSKYTTEVRYICEVYSGLTESVGYDKIDEVLNGSWNKVFDFDFPMFDDNYRKALCIADNFICMDQERIEGFRDAFEPGETFRWEIPKTEKAYKFQRIFRS